MGNRVLGTNWVPTQLQSWIRRQRTGSSVSMICTFLQLLLQPSQIKGPRRDSPGRTSGVGWGPGGNSDLRDFFKDRSRTPPSPLHTSTILGSWIHAWKGFLGEAGIGAAHRVTGQVLSQHTSRRAEPWGGVKTVKGSGAQRPRGALAGSSFRECQIQMVVLLSGLQLPSCLQGSPEHPPASQLASAAIPRRWLCHGWAQLHLNWWPTNLH